MTTEPEPTPAPAAKPEPPFASASSAGFADILTSMGVTLLVTTYQAGKLLAVRGRDGQTVTLLRTFDRPMGLAVRSQAEFALLTRSQIWLFRNAPELAAEVPPKGQHDACFMPRVSHVTGDIRGHEMAWIGDRLWIVNTFHSCLCTLDGIHSFVPRWRPPFLPELAKGDQCHLNGLAVADGQPRFVTALGETTTPQGWRETKATGGIVMDVARNQVVCRGLSMPHSPRIHAGRLWVLESGTGRLLVVDPATGDRHVVADFPGFARGLVFHGPYAFIGVSKIREKSLFTGLPIAEKKESLLCGVWVIDFRSGRISEFLRFDAGVEEIFALDVLPGCRFPEIIGFQEEAVHNTFVLPPG